MVFLQCERTRIDLVASFKLYCWRHNTLNQDSGVWLPFFPQKDTSWWSLLSCPWGDNGLQMRRQRKLIGKRRGSDDKDLESPTIDDVAWFSCQDRGTSQVIPSFPIVTFLLDVSGDSDGVIGVCYLTNFTPNSKEWTDLLLCPSVFSIITHKAFIGHS